LNCGVTQVWRGFAAPQRQWRSGKALTSQFAARLPPLYWVTERCPTSFPQPVKPFHGQLASGEIEISLRGKHHLDFSRDVDLKVRLQSALTTMTVKASWYRKRLAFLPPGSGLARLSCIQTGTTTELEPRGLLPQQTTLQ